MEMKLFLLVLVATLVSGVPRSHRPNCRRNLPKKCVDAPMDIIFLIDGSNSLKPESFVLEKHVVINFIEEQGVENKRYAVLQIASNVTEEISLNQYYTVEQYTNAIRNIGFYQGGTMTAKAIRYMVEHTLRSRPAINTKAIVITDGAAQDFNNLKTASDLAKSVGVEMFAVGVEIPPQKKEKCWEELKMIASKPKRDHAFLVRDYYQLENKKKIWENVRCHSPCTCNEGYVMSQDKSTCHLRPRQLIPEIVDLEVDTTVGSTNVYAEWRLDGVTEYYELIDYYYVTITRIENGYDQTVVDSRQTRDAYFRTDLPLGYSYMIHVVGTTTKGNKTNKVSKMFDLQEVPGPLYQCTCDQQQRNHDKLVEKMEAMTSMLQQLLYNVELIEDKMFPEYPDGRSEELLKKWNNKKLN